MKLPRGSLIWCVLKVCLTLLIFTYLTRKSLCEIRYRDSDREVAAFMAYKSAK
ncbi:type I toxin-antitoxin system Hok family toxin [Salmonella enterica]|nr:type I toxin-antitoxin system Hok family toxin [Salmonella enterica]